MTENMNCIKWLVLTKIVCNLLQTILRSVKHDYFISGPFHRSNQNFVTRQSVIYEYDFSAIRPCYQLINISKMLSLDLQILRKAAHDRRFQFGKGLQQLIRRLGFDINQGRISWQDAKSLCCRWRCRRIKKDSGLKCQ
jgi:hypothetical protein